MADQPLGEEILSGEVVEKLRALNLLDEILSTLRTYFGIAVIEDERADALSDTLPAGVLGALRLVGASDQLELARQRIGDLLGNEVHWVSSASPRPPRFPQMAMPRHPPGFVPEVMQFQQGETEQQPSDEISARHEQILQTMASIDVDRFNPPNTDIFLGDSVRGHGPAEAGVHAGGPPTSSEAATLSMVDGLGYLVTVFRPLQEYVELHKRDDIMQLITHHNVSLNKVEQAFAAAVDTSLYGLFDPLH